MNNLIKNFKKYGVVEIKNFFTDTEINLLSKRAEEIMNNNFEFLYLINVKKINNSFLIKSKFNSIRNEILESCKEKELKLKTLNNFIDFFQPILKKYGLKDYIFEELHTIFCEHFGFPEDLFYDDIFSSIFFTDKVLNVYRELLESNNLIYYGESTCGYNKPACTFKDNSKLVHQGWHSDDPLNYAKNTSEKTYMLRGSVFYHSDDKKSGGTKFLPGSHYFISPNKLCKKNNQENVIQQKISKFNFEYKNFIFEKLFSNPKRFYFMG